MHGWDEGWHMGGMWIWWLLGAALVAAVVWLLVRTGRSGREARHESPEQILKRRHANGETDREEFERRLQDLRK